MPQTTSLEELLDELVPGSDLEAADLGSLSDLRRSGDPWSRSSPVHVTCSAVIIHPPTQRVLLRWHKRQQGWLQVGGHADPGESDPFAIARREAAEETGLDDLEPWPGSSPRILHLVVVPVPGNEVEPAHEHADLRFVLSTHRPDAIEAESDDAPLQWLSIADASRLTTEDNLRTTLARIAGLFEQV
jgi:8-oxo-dGTP pyrophosphatase MutT (NUDIX family)